MRADYTLYKAKYNGRWHWRARFLWDEKSGKYAISRSLGVAVEGKKQRRWEAEEAAERIARELRNLPAPDAETGFVPYLEQFWGAGSDYIEEQEHVNKTPLSSAYIENNRRNIRLHISPYPAFAGLLLTELSRKIIREYKLWAAKQGCFFSSYFLL